MPTIYPSPLVLFDASLGAALIALLSLIALLAFRDAWQSAVGRVFFLVCVSISALTLLSHPIAGEFGIAPTIALVVVAAPNVGLVWALCCLLLSDSQRRSGWMIAVVLALSVVPLILGLAGTGLETALAETIAPYGTLPLICAALHLGWIAMSQYRGDLIASRRRVRFLVVGTMVIACLLSVLSEDLADPQWQTIVRNGVIGLPTCFLFLLWLVRMESGRLEFAPATKHDPLLTASIDPRDRHVVEQIDRSMRTDSAFLDPDISIERLAVRLDVPVHRLRAIINRAMGHRNFASFINGYRVDFAKAALADPARGRETILAIAYESGFSSLQTFNRVFRDIVGMTPTDHRRASLAPLICENSTP